MIKKPRLIMLAHILIASALVIAGCTSPNQRAPGVVEQSFKVYEGAWFQIRYPGNFTPRTSLASKSADGHDSVFFQSPDASIELYVCSPQWGRATPDIALVEAVEMLVSEERVARGVEFTRNWTIVAEDGSYTRTYEETESADGSTRTVFGIRYPDASTRKLYDPIYTQFKNSLVQYAD